MGCGMTDDLFSGLADFIIAPAVARCWQIHQRSLYLDFIYRRAQILHIAHRKFRKRVSTW